MDKEKNVGIWIRVSTEDQAQGDSPEHHEVRARHYAESKGWKVKQVYHLEATSGKTVKEHPETKRMLKDVKNGRISGLIFSKLARLARNTYELLDFADYFQEHDADLISLQESIDTSSPAGRLFFTMIAAIAQWEREEIADRVAASVPVRAKLGKPTGGPAIFGYMWKDKKLVPNPKEAPVRKLIYELFLEHKRKKTVARILNEQGYRTRKDAKFGYSTVARLLRDPTAKGLHRVNYTKSLGTNKQWKLKPEEDWVYVDVEPIVSKELWDTCNQILDEQESLSKKPVRREVKLFTGVTFCHCGGKMYMPSNSPKYICQNCRNKIPKNDLEEVFHAQLKDFVFSSSEIAEQLSQTDRQIKQKTKLLTTLTKEQKKIKKEMDKLFQLHVDGQITKKGFGQRHKPLEERFQQISRQIPELEGEIDYLKVQYLSSDQIISDSKNLHSRWKQLSEEAKRTIIENITEKIVIGKGSISISLNYLPLPLN
jgi:site-specific DNA recombinase